MRLMQTTTHKLFTVEHEGKEYHVSFITSDKHTLALLNRYAWEITDEHGEELDIFHFSTETEKEKRKIEENARLFDSIVKFCISKG